MEECPNKQIDTFGAVQDDSGGGGAKRDLEREKKMAAIRAKVAEKKNRLSEGRVCYHVVVPCNVLCVTKCAHNLVCLFRESAPSL